MSRTCGACRLSVRRDENLVACQAGGDIYTACPRCVAGFRSEPAPEPVRYPVGCHYPHEPGTNAPLTVCGICRLALYEDDHPRSIRLAEGDKEGIEPGCYAACRDCHRELVPVISRRLQLAGLLPAGATAQGYMLV